MKDILVIFKKELKRIFTDRRMLFAMFLPGILIFVVYSCLGNFIPKMNIQSKFSDVTYRVAYTDNSGAATPKLISYFDAYLSSSEDEKTNSAQYTVISPIDTEEAKSKILSNELDLLITFTDNFESFAGQAKDNRICLFYNGGSSLSSSLYQKMNALVDLSYKGYFTNQNPDGSAINPNLSNKNSDIDKVMSFIFPMISISLLFSAVLSVCPETIAGEKERGTLANILLTPIKRTHFVLGKVFAMAITAIASGLVSFLGLAGSLPTLLGGAFSFTAPAIIGLACITISALLLFVSLGVLVSSFANSVKEATSYLGPCTILMMVLSLIPAFAGGSSGIGFAFVPILNVSASMASIISGEGLSIWFALITFLVNLLVTGLLVLLTTRLFKRERVVLAS